jgi:hypothetical protein
MENGRGSEFPATIAVLVPDMVAENTIFWTKDTSREASLVTRDL